MRVLLSNPPSLKEGRCVFSFPIPLPYRGSVRVLFSNSPSLKEGRCVFSFPIPLPWSGSVSVLLSNPPPLGRGRGWVFGQRVASCLLEVTLHAHADNLV